MFKSAFGPFGILAFLTRPLFLFASEYYGLNKGQDEFSTVYGTVTNSTDIEVRVDLTKYGPGTGTGGGKGDVLKDVEKILREILRDRGAIFG